ncbi:MAG TPA: LamG-like jellyroll fold domain-containing protein, partial [Luteolibacter sp.]
GYVTTQNQTYNGNTAIYQNHGFRFNNLTVASGGTWNIVWGGETLGALNGPGNVSLNCQSALNNTGLTLGGTNTSGTYAGSISGGFGIVKTGTGTQILSGANTYAGATAINGGTLLVNGSLSNTATTVAAAGTLGGTGGIGGAVTNNGTLAPGAAGIGNLTVTNALTLAPASAIDWQISNWTGSAGSGFDKLTATSLNITATSANPVIIRPESVALVNFTEENTSFVLVQTTTGITGFSANKFVVYPTALTLPQGTWSVQQSGNNLLLVYTRYNTAPIFTADPITAGNGLENYPYSGQTISGSAEDGDLGESLSYMKVSGPAWLTVAANGSLSGTPPAASSGTHLFVVRVTDAAGATDETNLTINVQPDTDADHDGLPLSKELTAGTNPNLVDTDGDGFSDGFELSGGGNPLDASSRPTAAAVASWNFDDTSESGISRERVGAVTGSLMSGAVLGADASGRTGQTGDRALDLGTTNAGQRMDVTNLAFLNAVGTNNQLTISFWQKLATTGVARSAFWAISPTSGDGQRGLQAHTPWSDGKIYFDCGHSAAGYRVSGTPSGVTWTNWNHIALVRKPGIAEIWVNGSLVASASNMQALKSDFTLLQIGSANGGTNCLRGKLDDFTVFRTA